MIDWLAKDRSLFSAGDPRPLVMGILNVTPDSFSDGGRSFGFDDALANAERLIAEGADLIDVGGESSRPGAEPVGLDEELRRVVPVVEAIAVRWKIPISVDTTKPEVARQALAAGAAIINDINGLREPAMAEVAAGTQAGVVVMHMAGTPQTMQLDPRYDDVVEEVHAFLKSRVEALESLGISRRRIAVDPGIGFGKTAEHNRLLLRNLGRFATLNCAILVGTSRKRFLGKLTGRGPDERLTASVVSGLASLEQGARIVRVHDVAAMIDAITVWGAIRGWTS